MAGSTTTGAKGTRVLRDKLSRKRPQRARRETLHRLWLLVLAPAALGLILAARGSTAVANWYAERIYKPLALGWGAATGLVPFSLAEWALLAAALGVLFYIAHTVRACIRRPQLRKRTLVRFGATVLSLSCVVLFWFTIFCGVNYYRSSFSVYSGLTVRDSPVEELRGLCAELVEQTNRQSLLVPRNAAGEMILDEHVYGVARRAQSGYARLEEHFPVLAGGRSLRYAQPKPLLSSPLVSYTQISGFFFPYTMEANVNLDGPAYTVPATMMHELSHLRGFMREDEANFLAYWACQASEDPLFAYSGSMLALVHAMNALYAADYAAWEELAVRYEPGIWADFSAQSAYLDAHDGMVAEISDTVNDTYLKVNSQADGVKSYGRIVDLLLADYRARHGLE